MAADATIRSAATQPTSSPDRPAHGPVTARRRLRTSIRRARDQRGLTQEQVAEAMDWSLSKLIRIENGLVNISTNDLRALLGYYGLADADEVQRLIELARVSRARPWWSDYRDILASPHFTTMLGLEADVHRLNVFNSSTVPGLLQTEAYVRRSMAVLVPEETGDQVEAKVAVRLRRQAEVFDRPDPPEVLAVLDESVLRRTIADRDAMRAQLRHLTMLGERPNVTIEVVSFAAGVYDLAGPFTILSFLDGEDNDAVYLENALNEYLIEDAERIKQYHLAFDAIRARALDAHDSLLLINEVADALR